MSVELEETEVLEDLDTPVEAVATEEETADASTQPTTGEVIAALKRMMGNDKRPRAMPACQSPKKTKKGAEHTRKPRVSFGAGIRIVVVPSAETSAEEELLILRAMELLKMGHDQLKLVYITRQPLIQLMLKPKPWFLAEAHWHGFDDVDEVVGEDVLIELGVPSHEECLVAEEDAYRLKHERLVDKLQREQREAEERGVKDLKIDIPPYRFQPHWHKGNGLLWKLQDDLGLPLNVPNEPLMPYNRVPRMQEKWVSKKLSHHRLTDAPFVIYDFRDEENVTPLLEVLQAALPAFRLISIAEIERSVGEGILPLLVCMGHVNCQWFVGGRMPGLYAAWAGGVPGVVQVFRGEDPIWDGIHAEDNYLLQRDNVPDTDLPAGIFSGISYIYYSTAR